MLFGILFKIIPLTITGRRLKSCKKSRRRLEGLLFVTARNIASTMFQKPSPAKAQAWFP